MRTRKITLESVNKAIPTDSLRLLPVQYRSLLKNKFLLRFQVWFDTINACVQNSNVSVTSSTSTQLLHLLVRMLEHVEGSEHSGRP